MPTDLPPGVDPEDIRAHKQRVGRCWVVAGLLLELPLEDLERLAAAAETGGPSLFPDIWRKNSQAIMEDREMLAALVAAQRHLTTSCPSLVELAPILSAEATRRRPQLEALFREMFSRSVIREIPPAVVLVALVRFIGDRAPDVV